MHGVSRTLCDNPSPDAATRERKVANQVEHLMANKFIVETKRAILHGAFADDDGAIIRCTANQSHVPQHGFVFAKPEGARRRNQITIRSGLEIADERLVTDRCGKVDAVVDGVPISRVHADKLAADFRTLAHFHRLQNAEVLTLAALLLQTGFGNRFDIRLCTAIENRHFEVVDFDDDVVDAEADQRGEQVLGGGYQHTLAHQAGGVADLRDVASVSGNFVVIEISATEHDPGARRRRNQPHRHLHTRMKTYPTELKWTFNRAFELCIGRQRRSLLPKTVARLHAFHRGSVCPFRHTPLLPTAGLAENEAMVAIETLQRTISHGESTMLAKLRELVEVESPSDDKAAVDRAGALVSRWAEQAGGRVVRHAQQNFGDVLEIRFGPDAGPRTLVLGHLDTVWPIGTLAKMPWREEDGKIFGPGVLDMKVGVMMALTAIESLQQHGEHPAITLLLNSEEEIGSPISRPITERLAQECAAVFVLEPAQGLAYKTARKGVGNFHLHVAGVGAHAGVDFEKGHSAVLEMSRLIQQVSGWIDLDCGLTVNAGVISGGTKSNVIAAECTAEIDVRVVTMADAAEIEARFKALSTTDPECKLTVTGGINRPPMERGLGTVALFERAKVLAAGLGFSLEEASTGGGSDGNFTAALGVPTLDGMGAVGAGAHAAHEHIVRAHLIERTTMLAGMLAMLSAF